MLGCRTIGHFREGSSLKADWSLKGGASPPSPPKLWILKTETGGAQEGEREGQSGC